MHCETPTIVQIRTHRIVRMTRRQGKRLRARKPLTSAWRDFQQQERDHRRNAYLIGLSIAMGVQVLLQWLIVTL